jgi:hypothetical protein
MELPLGLALESMVFEAMVARMGLPLGLALESMAFEVMMV